MAVESHSVCTISKQFKMGDEEVIRRRLQFDGEGTGDERRLNVLLKSFVKWCNSTESPEEAKANCERIMAQIAQCEFSMIKSQLCSAMNVSELKHYEELYGKIESEIEAAKKDIELTKAELHEARRVRRNKMEYDALAAVIQTQPDRQETQKKLEQLRKELDATEAEQRRLEMKLQSRQKQFHLLIMTIQGLQKLLQNDDEETEESEPMET